MILAIFGFLAFIAAIFGMFASSAATSGVAVIAAFYVMFKIIYCFKVIGIQEQLLDQLKALNKSRRNDG